MIKLAAQKEFDEVDIVSCKYEFELSKFYQEDNNQDLRNMDQTFERKSVNVAKPMRDGLFEKLIVAGHIFKVPK